MLELSGTLAGKDVYLITGVDSSYGDIDDYVVSQADLRLDYESPVHFNGDDAVGLLKMMFYLTLLAQTGLQILVLVGKYVVLKMQLEDIL